MSATLLSSRVVILVKALPQPSKRYGETVCCAGVTADRLWKRLFPVRFRHLRGDSSFSRWDWINFKYRRPTNDPRSESCHVYEDSIVADGALPVRERATLLDPLVLGSAKKAAERGHSLALIRPQNTKFSYRAKSAKDLENEREAYRRAARQTSILDKDLAGLEPSAFEFRFQFTDDGGKHDYENGDWETHAMFHHWRDQYGEAETLRRMDHVFNDQYPAKGMVFAIGMRNAWAIRSRSPPGVPSAVIFHHCSDAVAPSLISKSS
jgi:hypothetical protein